jgi:predicted acetyltransferase
MLILRMPTVADHLSLLAAHRELALEGHDEFLLNGFSEDDADFDGYIRRVIDYSLGQNLTEGHVPATFFVAEVEGEIVGRVSIRHALNEFLENYGGHIGYMVRPSFRRNGYATEMLKQALQYCKSFGLESVLVTCNDNNVGSQKVIEANGGVLENKLFHHGVWKRRYWIEIV